MFDLSIYPDKVKTYEALYEYIEAIAYLDFQQAEINLNYPIFDISQCKNNCDDKRDCSG